ncbi:MAG: hypothetical protein PVF70_05805 [Anaerolineales bacterium]
MARRSGFLLLLAMIIVATQACGTGPSADEGPTNCGTDIDCFIQAATDCQPSSVTYQQVVEIFDIEIGAELLLQIQGADGPDCAIHLRVEDVEVTFSDELMQELRASGMTDQEIEDQVQQIVDEALAQGREDTCRGSAADLVDLLTRWKDGNFAEDDWAPFTCEGNIFGP